MDAAKESEARRAPLWLRRIGWMVLLWLGGVATLAMVAFLLKMVMRAAGMH